MTCHELIDFLMHYVDGDLPPQERQKFDAHLAACPACARYLDSYRKTIALGKASLTKEYATSIPQELVNAILASRGK